MTANLKPLKWTPPPDAGFTVVRRPDGGMLLTFRSVDHSTLAAWRAFALEHLLDSDRLTRNLYDLREIAEIPAEAVQFALEAISDPAARNIRLAIVVASETVREAVLEIAANSAAPGGGPELRLFTSMAEAEAWLSRPLNLLP